MKRSDFGIAASAGVILSTAALTRAEGAIRPMVTVASAATPPPDAFIPPAGPIAIFKFDDANFKFRPPASLADKKARDKEFSLLTTSPSASLTVEPYYFSPESALAGLKKTQSTLRFRFDQGSAFPTTSSAVKPQAAGWSTTFILLNTDPNSNNGGFLSAPIQLATPDAFKAMPFVDGQIKCDMELKHTLVHISDVLYDIEKVLDAAKIATSLAPLLAGTPIAAVVLGGVPTFALGIAENVVGSLYQYFTTTKYQYPLSQLRMNAAISQSASGVKDPDTWRIPSGVTFWAVVAQNQAAAFAKVVNPTGSGNISLAPNGEILVNGASAPDLKGITYIVLSTTVSDITAPTPAPLPPAPTAAPLTPVPTPAHT